MWRRTALPSAVPVPEPTLAGEMEFCLSVRPGLRLAAVVDAVPLQTKRVSL